MLDIIVLAAGKGTRMKSDLPKVLHSIGGKPMLEHVITTAQQLGDSLLHIVTGHGASQVEATFTGHGNLSFIKQEQQLGTGHAVQQVLPSLQKGSVALILYGDVPLISATTLQRLLSVVNENALGLLTITLDDPSGYGRIVRNANGLVTSIVEQKDATAEQLDIQEINTGIMAVNNAHLEKWLPALSNNNAQGEYYLTDIIAMAVEHGVNINAEEAENEWEVMGINNRQQQAQLERIHQQNVAKQLMIEGVTLLDPSRFDCRGGIDCGSDVVIDVNCIFEGNNTIGNNVIIGPNCLFKNAVIGDNTEIKANTMIEDSQLAGGCTIGPFARLRPGTQLAEGAKIGNFVETKKAFIGKGSKVNHLSYIGDATLGQNVNVGAGTITCNYDGVNKHQTTIGDDVFVGSNTALVAPINLDNGSTVGAGSTISKDVKEGVLALTRSPQKNINGWQRPMKKDS